MFSYTERRPSALFGDEMKYSDFTINLIGNNSSEQEVLNELTEREIETDNEEFLAFCEYLREKLANRADSQSWENALCAGIENYNWHQERSNGTHGET